MSGERCQVSVIMPALDEEGNLAASLAKVQEGFRASGIRGEIVVVDDGSRDGTGPLAEEWAARFPNVRVIHHPKPEGVGAAFWHGVREARGEMVCMVPGDGENDPSEIFRYLPLMEHVDIVVPFVFNPGVRPWWRRLLSFTYHEIIYVTFALSLNYLNGTVLYRREILEGIPLHSRGFFYQTELLLRTIRSSYLYAEVPCALGPRRRGRSKAVTFPSLVEVVRAYCRIVMDVHLLGKGKATIVPGSATARRMRGLSRGEG